LTARPKKLLLLSHNKNCRKPSLQALETLKNSQKTEKTIEKFSKNPIKKINKQ
jgi:hypothetical protein